MARKRSECGQSENETESEIESELSHADRSADDGKRFARYERAGRSLWAGGFMFKIRAGVGEGNVVKSSPHPPSADFSWGVFFLVFSLSEA